MVMMGCCGYSKPACDPAYGGQAGRVVVVREEWERPPAGWCFLFDK